MRLAVLAALLFSAVPASVYGQAMEPDQVPISFALSTNPHTYNAKSTADGGGVLGGRSNGSVLGIDSVVNWSSYFYEQGFDSFGNTQFTWQYTMVGRAPFGTGESEGSAETTEIRAPVVPVSLDLRTSDGSPRSVNGHRLFSDGTRYVNPVLQSPVFSNTSYGSSSSPTQFTDAVQRAEFFNRSSASWHTLLVPRVKTARVMQIDQDPTCNPPMGHCNYRFALNADGSCCAFILIDAGTFSNSLFPPTSSGTDTTTIVGAAETSGDIRTRDISTFLFPNAYLYIGNLNNCCILGFHGYDIEQGGPDNGFRERRYVLNYSSWISPGIFGGGFSDVTALSHELSETFNDPFVNNATPWWLSPNGNCQNNLEVGDVIEGLPNGVFPVALNGFTYHPQNEALLQWFAGVTPSTAISGAYSYPDTNVLASANVSQNLACTPPLP
jgi:hypothetical protein